MFPLFFADRNRRSDEYPWLPWKVRAFTIGAVLAVVGMVREDNRIIAAATVVLAIGFLLRFLPSGKGVKESDDKADETELPPGG